MAASSAVGTSSVRIFLSTFRRPSRIRDGGAGNLIYRILPPPRGLATAETCVGASPWLSWEWLKQVCISTEPHPDLTSLFQAAMMQCRLLLACIGQTMAPPA